MAPPHLPSVLLSVFLLFSSRSIHASYLKRHFQSSLDVRSKQREFDYFKLALQWPGTCCQKTSHCCPSNGCCLKSGPLVDFTIHGLWPDYNDGTWPSCCRDDDFDIKKISSLLGTIQKYWPSLSCSSASLCHGGKGLFWAHEWGKHGTCSSPIIKDEYSYFSTVLDLYFKYNMTRILNDAGFQTSTSYLLGDIVHAIREAVGATPQLICSHGNVEELRLCFYKDFKPRDCDSINNNMQKSSCPKRVNLPVYVSSGNKWLPRDEAFQVLSELWLA